MLQKKLSRALGANNASGAGIVDWEVNGVRTSPIDHFAENAQQLDKIASGLDKASEYEE